MAVIAPESPIQVLSVGMERNKKFSRMILPVGCISFRMAVSPHLCGWNWEDELTIDTATLWAKIKFKDFHCQYTNIILATASSQFLVMHYSDPHGTLYSGNGRGEEGGSFW